MFWKTRPKTTGAEHAAAVSRSSADWQSEIQRLSAELDQATVERASLLVEAGKSSLDQQHARARDLADQIREADTRREILTAAITAATDRPHDAEADEQRRRLSATLREYLGLQAAYCGASVGVREAEEALSRAVVARRQAVDMQRLGVLFDTLSGAGLVREALADVIGRCGTADDFRSEAERLGRLAETTALDDAGVVHQTDEHIDRATLPPTAKDREVAAIKAALPEMERRRAIGVLDSQLRDARGRAALLRQDRTSHSQDRETVAAKIDELEQQRAALVEEVEVPA
jgi:chromosome segregation ATPase